MNRTQYLQEILDSLLNDRNEEPEPEPQWFIEFRPFTGWFVVPSEARHFYDNGEFLGRSWKTAEKAMRSFF